MPIKKDFAERLYPVLPEIVKEFGTPFHIYDEKGIIENGEKLKAAFAAFPGFQEFYAVKACPNLTILSIMRDLGFGFDCSSLAELELCRIIEVKGEQIMFTSNNTTLAEFKAAAEMGCILNLDDITMIEKVPVFPELICFRYNPGISRQSNNFIGHPDEAKYGVCENQIINAYRLAQARGAKRFGLHCMISSNEPDYKNILQNVKSLLVVSSELSMKLGIEIEFINIGGGIGIPYRPEGKEFNLKALAVEAAELMKSFGKTFKFTPKLFMESGRYMTGPYGVLVTSVINRMSKYREHVGVDACMSALMRPALYDAYHHITVLNGEKRGKEKVDVVGSLCENNDKFAVQRELPKMAEGDIVIIHDTGAHGYAMGFNYNGRLRPQELILTELGNVQLIRRAETLADYTKTFSFMTRVIKPKSS